MKKIRAIKIDATACTVTEIEIESGLQPLYKELDCHLVEKVTLDGNHDLILDEEGWIRVDRKNEGFRFLLMDGAFIGHGLIVGYNDEGEWISHCANVETVAELVEFVTFKERINA